MNAIPGGEGKIPSENLNHFPDTSKINPYKKIVLLEATFLYLVSDKSCFKMCISNHLHGTI